ncbi:phage integrase SAM-like domain-containing protein [Spirosoma jeollabukense]
MIPIASWDMHKQKVKRDDPQAVIINKAIVECENKLNKIYNQHERYDVIMNALGVKRAVINGGRVRPSIPDLIEKFLAEKTALKANLSTTGTYRFKFRPLVEFLRSEGIYEQAAEDFSPGPLKRFRVYLITTRGNSEQTADKTRQVVKTLLLWAAESEIIMKNPLLHVRIHVDKAPTWNV